MPAKNPDLHGSAPDKAPTVLLLKYLGAETVHGK
jgi:hypothetical protein